jgi:hypothetical protein
VKKREEASILILFFNYFSLSSCSSSRLTCPTENLIPGVFILKSKMIIQNLVPVTKLKPGYCSISDEPCQNYWLFVG